MRMNEPPAGRATACAREARRRGPKPPRGSKAEAIPGREKCEGNLDSELGVDLERHADVGDPNLARQSWPVGSSQAGFGKPEGDGRLCLHTWSVGDAGVGVEARGHIDRYDPRARGVDRLDPRGEVAFWSSRDPGAENCVEHHLGVFEQQCLGDVDAKLAQRVELLFGGTVQATGVDASNRCQASPAVKVAGGRQAVAGVVADAACDDGAALTEPG